MCGVDIVNKRDSQEKVKDSTYQNQILINSYEKNEALTSRLHNLSSELCASNLTSENYIESSHGGAQQLTAHSNFTMVNNKNNTASQNEGDESPITKEEEISELTPTSQTVDSVDSPEDKKRYKRKSATPVDQRLLDEYDASESMDGIFVKNHCYQALIGHRKFATFPIQYDSRCVSPFQCDVTGVSWNSWNMAWVANWYENGKLSAEYFHTNKKSSGEEFERALQAAIAKRKDMEKKLNITPRKGARGPRYSKEEALHLAIKARNDAVRRGDIVPKSIKRARFRSGVTGVIWNDNNMAWQAHWKENGRSHVSSFPTGRTTSGDQFQQALSRAIEKRKEMEVKLHIKPREDKGKEPKLKSKRRKLDPADFPMFEPTPRRSTTLHKQRIEDDHSPVISDLPSTVREDQDHNVFSYDDKSSEAKEVRNVPNSEFEI